MYESTLSQLVETGFAPLVCTHPFVEIFTRSFMGGELPPDAVVSPSFIPEEVRNGNSGIVVCNHMMRLLIANALENEE
jgi:hypothetical protein